MARLLLVAAALAAAAAVAAADATVFGQTFAGDATYYGYRTRGFGHCSFHFHGFGDSKGYVGTPLAINAAQYTGPAVCGLCLKYRGVGQGAGGNPVSTSWQPGFICDQCPECKFGDIDQQMGGDGRWKVEWYPVQCPVGDSKFRFGFQNGNPWYRKMMVANARVPLRSVRIWQDGGWRELTKTIDNYWEFHGDASKVWAPCARIEVTSILGDTVTDSVCCGYGTCAGSAQFPCRADLPSDDCKSEQQPAKINVGGIGAAGEGSRTSAESTKAAIASGGSGAGAGAAALGRRGGDLSAARVAGTRALAFGEQCGGKAFDCRRFGADQCRDAQFDNTSCDAGTTCTRNDENWWGCK